tara:strand:+ start:70 stop:630 length:561 start_codon:yes stop_codon:yes gene_type:complete
MPEYYKTKKGYYYKKTQKGGSTRISKNNYEKAVKRQEGGGILFSRKSKQQNSSLPQSPKEVYNETYNNSSTHTQYYMRYNEPYNHIEFKDSTYKWDDEFYKLEKKHKKYFNVLIYKNENDNVGRVSPNTQNMIFSRYLKIIHQSTNYEDFNNLLIEDNLFNEHQGYKESLNINSDQYDEILNIEKK